MAENPKHLLTPLTDEERSRIEDVPSSLGRLIEVWEVILARFDTTIDDYVGDITPWEYALPHDDAVWAAQQVIDAETDPLTKANRALDWASKGPSYYQVKERTP